jgi:hypothetical protein
MDWPSLLDNNGHPWPIIPTARSRHPTSRRMERRAIEGMAMKKQTVNRDQCHGRNRSMVLWSSSRAIEYEKDLYRLQLGVFKLVIINLVTFLNIREKKYDNPFHRCNLLLFHDLSTFKKIREKEV